MSGTRGAAVVAAGIICGQLCLYGSALVGRQLLLPLDLLKWPLVYLPDGTETESLVPRDPTQMDLVLQYEMIRRFSASEVWAGRWPLWSPYGYAGAPFFGIQGSPFQILYVLWPSPRALAWMQLCLALFAGFGAYRFCRDACQTDFWPAAIAAWFYPLTAYFVLWQGHALTHSAACLPWLVWAVDRAFRRPLGWAGPTIALATYSAICGALDVAGQALLVSGVYAIWQAVAAVRRGEGRNALQATIVVATGWCLGFVMTFAGLLPFVEYASAGARLQDRAAGVRERPPIGISQLPNVIVPELQGMVRPGSLFLGRSKSANESTAAAYAGLIASCLLAPLALLDRNRRGQFVFWTCFAVAGLAWSLDLPGFVAFYNAPVLRNLSFNRFVFVTGWAIVVLSAIGLDLLWNDLVPKSVHHAWPAAALAGLAMYFLWCVVSPPEPMASQLEAAIFAGRKVPMVETIEAAQLVRAGFQRNYLAAAVTSSLACIGWVLQAVGRPNAKTFALALAAAWGCELIRFGLPWPLLSDPRWYYPPISALERVARAGAGRILGVQCLPPRLGERFGLRDVRGYDAVDPAVTIDMLECVADKSVVSPSYARTLHYTPRVFPDGDGGFRLPGVLDMLNVRYLIFRSPSPAITTYAVVEDGYWIWENPYVLPRPFVPRAVAAGPPSAEILGMMSGEEFDAAAVSYVEGMAPLSGCVGSAEIVREHSQEIVIDAKMETPGVVVLSDAWYSGWHATINGRPTPVLRVNHGVRGVAVPGGRSRIVMTYCPVSFQRGRIASLAGVVSLLTWGVLVWRSRAMATERMPG